MSTSLRCPCSRCTIRGLMGPAVITTLGVLFLLGELGHGMMSFSHTFPILFIVIGTILLAAAFAPMEGHVSGPGANAPTTRPPSPPPTYTNPYTRQGQ